MKTRALVYIRKSMVRNQRDEISPERQLANCLAAVEAHGWQTGESDTYQDAKGHRSGRTEDHRPAWQALKLRIETDPSVKAVVVNSLDRGSRSPKDFFNFIDLCHRHDVEIVSVKERFDTSTAIDRAFLAILMVVASLESDLASERTTSTIDYLKSKGRHWGFTPYGYTRNEEGNLVADDNAQAVVDAMTIYAESGRSYVYVARELNARGYRWRDKNGEPMAFNRYAVRSIISNVAIYAGWVPNGRCKDAPYAESLKDTIVITEAVPGLHLPIIDEDLADSVLRARTKRGYKGKHRDYYVYLLTPALICAECGDVMRGKAGRRNGHVYCHDKRSCSELGGSFSTDDLEEQALEKLNLYIPENVARDLRSAVMARTQAIPENQVVQEHIQGLRKQKERLRDLYLLGDCTREEYMTLKASIEEQMEEAESKLGGPDYPLESVISRLNQLGALLEEGTREQQKKAIGLIFERIFVDKEGKITEVEPKEWARPLFVDLIGPDGDTRCPQGNSNPCRRLERAVS